MKTKLTARAWLGERGHYGFKRCRTVAGHAVTDAEIETHTTLARMTNGKVEFRRWTPPAGAQLWDVWTNCMMTERDSAIWTKRTRSGYAWTLNPHPSARDFRPARTLHAALARAIASYKETGNK